MATGDDFKPKSGGSFGRLEINKLVPRPTSTNTINRRMVMGEDGDTITFAAGTIVEGLEQATTGNAPDLTDYYNKEAIDSLLVDKEDVTTGDTHALQADMEALDALDIHAQPAGIQRDEFFTPDGDSIYQEADVQTVAGAIAYNLELTRQVAEHQVSNATNTDYVTLVQPSTPNHLPSVTPFNQTELNGAFNEINIANVVHEVVQDGRLDTIEDTYAKAADYLPLSAGTEHKLEGGLYMQGNYVTGLPSVNINSNSDAVSYAGGDARYLQNTGGTLTGALTLKSTEREINAATGVAGHLKYSGVTKFTWGSGQNVSYQTLSMDNNRIQNVDVPIHDNDAATKNYVDQNAGSTTVEVYDNVTPPQSRDKGALLMTSNGSLYLYTSESEPLRISLDISPHPAIKK